MIPLIAILVASYLVGSVLFGPLVASRSGVDLYEGGSGNPGATNVERLIGTQPALLVLGLDAAKGAIAVSGFELARSRGLVDAPPAWVALAVVVGHCAPIAAPTRGGKGVSTALGAIAGLDVIAGLGFVVVYLFVRRASGFGSVASLVALVVAVALVAARTGASTNGLPLALLVTLVVVRHAGNLRRLARGDEPRAVGPPPDQDED